jgi:asparagine synthetase B (glutamine-hydrolysing)
MPDSKEGKPNPYMSQLSLFASPEMSVLSTDEGFGLAIDDEVNRLLAQQAPVAIGISGGKDSSAG